jgi:hypothetical protein
MPSAYSGAPKEDGVVILFATLPGGSRNDFNLGHVSLSGSLKYLEYELTDIWLPLQTLTHESGH